MTYNVSSGTLNSTIPIPVRTNEDLYSQCRHFVACHLLFILLFIHRLSIMHFAVFSLTVYWQAGPLTQSLLGLFDSL